MKSQFFVKYRKDEEHISVNQQRNQIKPKKSKFPFGECSEIDFTPRLKIEEKPRKGERKSRIRALFSFYFWISKKENQETVFVQ